MSYFKVRSIKMYGKKKCVAKHDILEIYSQQKYQTFFTEEVLCHF